MHPGFALQWDFGTTSEVDAIADRAVLGIDIDSFICKGGLKDRLLVVISHYLDPRFWKVDEKTPSCEIEPLEDKEEQEEVRQIIHNTKATRLDDVVCPTTSYKSCSLGAQVLRELHNTRDFRS